MYILFCFGQYTHKTSKRKQGELNKREKTHPLRAVTLTVVRSAGLSLLPSLTTLPGSLQGTSVPSLRITKHSISFSTEIRSA